MMGAIFLSDTLHFNLAHMATADSTSVSSEHEPPISETAHGDTSGVRLDADLDAENMTLSETEVSAIETEVDRLRPLVAEFPTKVLHVNLKYNDNSEDYEVRLALVLPGQTFATGGVTQSWHLGLETAVTKLIRRIKHYKEDLEGITDRRHHAQDTDHAVEPTQQIDGNAVTEAVGSGNYGQYRRLMFPFESALRMRIGRWVERYPQVNQMIGDRIAIADIMEEVFMLAFDRHDQWTPGLMYGPWLETLVDPAVEAIANDPEGELQAIGFQRSWLELDRPANQ